MTSLGAGRGGRKTMSGKRNRVLVYILYNPSDIAENVPGMTSEVREFCTTTCKCLKGSVQNQKLSMNLKFYTLMFKKGFRTISYLSPSKCYFHLAFQSQLK